MPPETYRASGWQHLRRPYSAAEDTPCADPSPLLLPADSAVSGLRLLAQHTPSAAICTVAYLTQEEAHHPVWEAVRRSRRRLGRLGLRCLARAHGPQAVIACAPFAPSRSLAPSRAIMPPCHRLIVP